MKKLWYRLINFFKCFGVKSPIIKENTFIVWEPCSKSHAEVVPGFTKYLLDMGYHVSVLVNAQRYDEGLFDRFEDENISFNFMSKNNIKKFFKANDLKKVKGVLVTTVGKLCKGTDLSEAYNNFSPKANREKIFFVEHDAKIAIDENRWDSKVITLRKLNYCNAVSCVVNPHYFGKVKITEKNHDIVNFVTVGAINPKRKNSSTIINAVKTLQAEGINNFKITVIGKGKLKGLPEELRKFFDIKGRLNFDRMYEELEKADFMLTAYDPDNELHQRYNTVGTSGNFQLVYGFGKPCIIINDFAELNGFTEKNSIIYSNTDDYADAMQKAIAMTSEDYAAMQQALLEYAKDIYNNSTQNLSGLIGVKYEK